MTIYRRHPLPTTFLSRRMTTHIFNNFIIRGLYLFGSISFPDRHQTDAGKGVKLICLHFNQF